MLRSISVLMLFAIACLVAGVYGAVHNQVSYTVSPEYFTKYKFLQFQIDTQLPQRVGAAYVGWQASWWMGIVIGIFVIPLGLIIRNTSEYVYVELRSFVLVLMTAITSGLVGLAIAYLTTGSFHAGDFSYRGQIISDPAAFRRAGMMHNFSYLGGVLGIFVAATSIVRTFLRKETGSATHEYH